MNAPRTATVRRHAFEPLVVDPKAARPLLPIAGGAWAFALGIGGAIAATGMREFGRMPLWERISFITLGGGMIALALGWSSREPRRVGCYWTLQALAATAITLASRGHGGLALLPVLAQTMIVLPAPYVAAFGTYVVAVIVCAMRMRASSWGTAAMMSMGHLSGAIFVVAFTAVVLRERLARLGNERLLVELEGAHARLRTFAAQAEELAASRERTRIAREVHDILGHALTGAHSQLTGALAILEREPAKSAALVQSARALTEHGLEDIRRSVAALRDGETKPFLSQLRSLLETAEQTGLIVELAVQGPPCEPSASRALALYRVVQECVTNAIRHGRASQVVVTLTHGEAGELRISVEDDGGGARTIVHGQGLRGIEERVTILGGEVTVEGRPGRGVRVEVRLP